MTAFFTPHAFEGMKRLAVRPDEKEALVDLLTALDAAVNPTDLLQSFPSTVQLAMGSNGDMMVVTNGPLRAIVTIEPGQPNQLVVAGVYRADEIKPQTKDIQRETLRNQETVLVK